MSKLLVVKLDNHNYGGGPGTVIAHVSTVDEYLVMLNDRDGAHNPYLRLWDGDYPVNTRVEIKDRRY